jgi:hypothetical protein
LAWSPLALRKISGNFVSMKPMVPFISCPRSKVRRDILEHLHQCLVCGPALEILDEVQQSFPVNSLERLRRPWKNAHLLGPLRSLEYRQILFIDCSLYMIG